MTADQLTPDEIFAEALRRQGSERTKYLDEVLGGDINVRERIERLLSAHAEAESFLETPAKDPLGTENDDRQVSERPGTVIGPYKLLQQIGEGGMGVVFMAEQTEPIQRTVALKIIKPGMDTRQVIARFEAERQALAMMDHPNIARVIDAGTTDTCRPYFVMDLVKGVPITEYCDQQHLPVRARLELMAEVCHAVQHAHQKGIIHRDLKPSNVLVAEYDGRPVPKVIDFGVAKATAQKLTERTMFTEYGQLVGTFEYMSPEQARFNQLDVDTRSDIYSLGVLLYEVLAGSTPLEKERLRSAAFDEVLRIICEEEPPRPSLRLSSSQMLPSISAQRQIEPVKLTKVVRGELDWIVMKCLEKDRNRRYETAGALAIDLHRYLNDEAVDARPSTRMYRLKKFVRRNKAGVLAGAAIAMALAIGLILSSIGFVQARRQAEIARAEAVRADREAKNARTQAARSKQVAELLKDMLKGVAPSVAQGRDTALLREILNNTAERIGKSLANQPEVEAEIRGTIGVVYDALGEYEQSEAMFRRALALRTSQSGGEDFDTAMLLVAMAWNFRNQGELAKAEAALRQSLAIRHKLLRKDDPLIPATLTHLAFIVADQGKLSEAEAMYVDAIALQRKLLPNDHADLTFTLNGLAVVFAGQGKLAEAETTYREALAMRRRVFGSDHEGLASTRCNLARVLQRQGKLAEAEVMFREAIATQRKMLSNDHPELYGGLYGLAEVLQGQSKSAEAEAAYREALTLQRKVVESTPNNPVALSELAWFLSTCPLAQLRDPDRAVALATKAVEIAPQQAGSWETLGVARYRAGEWQGAIDALDKSMALREGSNVTDSFVLPMAHWQLGHKDEARKLYGKIVDWMDNNEPKNEELARFRAEAATLLGISDKSTTTTSTLNTKP